MNRKFIKLMAFFHQPSYDRDNSVINSIEPISMNLFATSMSTQCVLSVKLLKRVRLFVL